MRNPNKLLVAFIVTLCFVSAGAPVLAQVSRPNPSPTAKGDAVMGFSFPVEPTPLPTCPGAGLNAAFADANGCVYICSGTTRNLVSAAGTCAFPTGALTATPTATATATPTATATATATATPTPTATGTATPTPTVTSTP